MKILRKLFSVKLLWHLYLVWLWVLCSGSYYWAIFPGWFGVHQPFLDSSICSLLIAITAAVTVGPVWFLLMEKNLLREAGD